MKTHEIKMKLRKEFTDDLNKCFGKYQWTRADKLGLLLTDLHTIIRKDVRMGEHLNDAINTIAGILGTLLSIADEVEMDWTSDIFEYMAISSDDIPTIKQ